MNRPTLYVLWIACVLCAFPAPAAEPTKPPEVIKGEGFAIVVPAAWRDMKNPPGKIVLFRQGDGAKNVPAVDETGQPLQIGLLVERYPNTKDAIEDGIQKLARNAQNDPRLERIGPAAIDKVKLTDGADAMLLTNEFVKDAKRHSLQLKMLVKDAADNGYVVSAFVVAGKESKLAGRDSALVAWLAAHVKSFCLDAAKVDVKPVEQAQTARDAK